MHYTQLMKTHNNPNRTRNIVDQRVPVNGDARDAIIRPIRIMKNDNGDTIAKMATLMKTYDTDKAKYYENRTNIPYKGIIKNAPIVDVKKKDDLIIHKVTNLDKNGLDEQYDFYKNNIKDQNNELQLKYPKSKEAEYKTKFEYNRLYKTLVCTENIDKNCKKDSIEFYKEEQEKMEKDRQTTDQIIESLLSSGLLSDDAIISNNKQDSPEIESDNISPIETKQEAKQETKQKGLKRITVIE